LAPITKYHCIKTRIAPVVSEVLRDSYAHAACPLCLSFELRTHTLVPYQSTTTKMQVLPYLVKTVEKATELRAIGVKPAIT